MTPTRKEVNLADPVTQHMRRSFTLLRDAQSVGEALAGVREHPPSERIIYFYVVDADGRLVGVVPTRRLLLAPLDRPVREIMVPRVVAIPQTATVMLACAALPPHRLL